MWSCTLNPAALNTISHSPQLPLQMLSPFYLYQRIHSFHRVANRNVISTMITMSKRITKPNSSFSLQNGKSSCVNPFVYAFAIFIPDVLGIVASSYKVSFRSKLSTLFYGLKGKIKINNVTEIFLAVFCHQKKTPLCYSRSILGTRGPCNGPECFTSQN